MSLLLAGGAAPPAGDPESRLRGHDDSLLEWIEDDGWHPDEADRFVDDFVLDAQSEALEDAHDDEGADVAPQLFDTPSAPDPNPFVGYDFADDGDDDNPDTALRRYAESEDVAQPAAELADDEDDEPEQESQRYIEDWLADGSLIVGTSLDDDAADDDETDQSQEYVEDWSPDEELFQFDFDENAEDGAEDEPYHYSQLFDLGAEDLLLELYAEQHEEPDDEYVPVAEQQYYDEPPHLFEQPERDDAYDEGDEELAARWQLQDLGGEDVVLALAQTRLDEDETADDEPHAGEPLYYDEPVALGAAAEDDEALDDEPEPWLEQFYDEPADELEIYPADHIDDGEDDDPLDALVQLYADDTPHASTQLEDDDEFDGDEPLWFEQIFDEPSDELEILFAEAQQDDDDDEAHNAAVQLYFDEPPFVSAETDDDDVDEAADLLAAIAERVILDEGIIRGFEDIADDDDDDLAALADVPAVDDIVGALGVREETEDDEREYELELSEAAPRAAVKIADWIVRARRRGNRG